MATRYERVVLDLEDRATNPMLRFAGATATANKALGDLDGTTVRTSRDVDRLGPSLSKGSTESQRLGREVDRMSGRMRLFADAALLLGPALVPIGAVAVPAVTALASQFGAAALAAGTAVLAFQGVGDALKAVNEAAIEPSAENIEKARLAMETLSPAARDLVRQLQGMRPAFEGLRDAAAEGLFPGLQQGLGDFSRVLPDVERVLFRIGDAAGDLGADLGEALASERGREFLDFIATEVPRALTELGHTVGNLAAGLGELWMAFTPLNRDVSGWLLDASRGFDQWASGLSQTEGFQDFVAYIRENGPRVGDALASIGNALVQIVTAAAPLGGPTLAALSAVADLIGAIAGSSYGPALLAVATGFTLITRSLKAMEAIKASSLFAGLSGAASGATTSLSRLQGAGLAASVGLTAAFAAGNKLVDLFREDLPGVEQLTGMLMDLSAGDTGALPAEFDSLAASIERITDPSLWKGQQTSDTVLGFFGQQGRTLTNATDEVEALEAALTNLVGLQGPEEAEAAFAAVAKNAGLSTEQIAQLRDLMPGYRDALAGAENQARATGDAAAKAGAEAAAGFRRATSAAQTFRNAIAAANRVLDRRDAVTAYEASVDALNKSIRENGKTLDKHTQAGRDNRDALSAAARSAVELSEKMNATNGIKVLTAARKDIVDAAIKLGKTRGEAQALADRLLGLDKINANPSVTLMGVEGLMADLARINSQLDYASRDRRTQITVAYANVGRDTEGGIQSRADGGTILGQRYPYRDRVLAYLAPGEEIISNRHGEADRFRADRAAGRIPAYADGGTVAAMNRATHTASSSFRSERVVERVVERLPREFAVDAGELGTLTLLAIDSRFGDHNAAQASRARTTYREPNLD